MKNFKIINTICVLVIMFTSCSKKFDTLQNDPNKPTSVPPNLILNSVLTDIYNGPFNSVQRWNQFYACNYAYYGNQEYNWSGISYNPYNTLKNIQKMEEESTKNVAAPNPYTALSKFLKAYVFYNLTMQVGDIPMSDALKSLNGLLPKYDSQKDVFKQILVLLEEANNDIATVVNKGNYVLANDYYYNNDLNKWRKAVNVFKLRVLTQLSKHENDTDLNIKIKFNETITNPTKYPIFSGLNHNMSYVYNNQFNKYPTNPESFGFDVARYNMSSTYLDQLVTLKDPRTFFVAEPASSLVAGGATPNSFAAFKGAGSGEDLANMSANAGLGKYSFINRKRYYSTFTAENCVQIGYAEMCFNIAEAINRGWTTGNAETWYQNGIKASINFYGITNGANTVYFQQPGGTLNDYNAFSINYDWATYYAQPTVQYGGNNASGLNQILSQKYLAFYQNSGWEAFYNWRRTNVPTFHTGSGSGNSNRVALRFQYPVAEKNVNSQNVNAAIQSQFAGNDDINQKIWVIK